MSSSIDSSVKLTKPFSSDTDLDKRDLQQDAELYRDKLEHQWIDLKNDATTYGKQALIIGGVIATTYVVMNAVLPDYKKDKNAAGEESEVRGPRKSSKKKAQFALGQAVQSLAWTLAVGWARQKLKHLIADDQKTE